MMKLAVMGPLPVFRAEDGATVKLSLTSGSFTTASILVFGVTISQLTFWLVEKLENGMLVKKW